MTTTEKIADILAKGKLADFVDLKEDQWFDAKQAPGYDLTPQGRYELAKDVSSFLNAEGGHIIIGLTTVPATDEPTDQVSGLSLILPAGFNANQIVGLLDEYLHPSSHGVTASWVEDVNTPGQGVGVIAIPQKPHDERLFLIGKVVEEGQQVNQIVFGYAVRVGSNSLPHNVERVRQMCQRGRTSLAQRLTRIEEKLDLQNRRLEEASQESSFDDSIQARIERMLAGG